MIDRLEDFLLCCEAMDFGKVSLAREECLFYRRFGNEIFSLCRSLPKSAQTDAMLFLMHYSGVRLGDEADFFANYYSPIWSIIYWLNKDHRFARNQLTAEDVTNAITGHTMAMFLHSLDDHLTDRQVGVSPLTLLLRSSAWEIMNRAFFALSAGVQGGERIVRHSIDNYYSANQDSGQADSLEAYSDVFLRQMGILMPSPVLLSMKLEGTSDFTKNMETAYGSFGVAWRLLDDIKDIREDMKRAAESAVYLSLPDNLKSLWKDGLSGHQNTPNDSVNTVLEYVWQYGLIDSIRRRIVSELERATRIAQAHGLYGLASEFRCLASPFWIGEGIWARCNGE